MVYITLCKDWLTMLVFELLLFLLYCAAVIILVLLFFVPYDLWVKKYNFNPHRMKLMAD